MDVTTLTLAKNYADSLALGGAVPIPGPQGPRGPKGDKGDPGEPGGGGSDYITQPAYADEPMATAFTFGNVAVGGALIFTEDSTMTFNDVTKVFEFVDVTGASKYRGTGSKIECSYLGNVTEVITQNGTVHPILGYMAFDYSCYVRGDISAITFSQPAAEIKVSDLTFSLFDDMKAKADVVGAMAAKEFIPKDGTPETGYDSLKKFLDGASPAIKSGLWHFPANWLDLPTRGEDYIVQIAREFGGANYTLFRAISARPLTRIWGPTWARTR